MASLIRACRPPLTQFASALQRERCQIQRPLSTAKKPLSCNATSHKSFPVSRAISPFHTTTSHGRGRDESPATDFGALDVLGDTPAPSTAIDDCTPDGFQFNNGSRVLDGAGVILVGGEAFAWRPWLPGGEKRLLNKKGQWEVSNETFGLLSLIWPRPDLLILGLGPEIRPISPDLRKYLSSLGMKVEVLDTRNAASQFNLLATERGIDEVAAALIPIGWKEGVGASVGLAQ